MFILFGYNIYYIIKLLLLLYSTMDKNYYNKINILKLFYI